VAQTSKEDHLPSNVVFYQRLFSIICLVVSGVIYKVPECYYTLVYIFATSLHANREILTGGQTEILIGTRGPVRSKIVKFITFADSSKQIESDELRGETDSLGGKHLLRIIEVSCVFGPPLILKQNC